MSGDITIPPEALHAAYAEWWRVIKSSSEKGRAMEAAILAAILAALRAWPEMQTGSDDGGVTLSGVYLPMTENTDE